MRKEVFFAIVIGLILGAAILFGFRLADKSTKEALISVQEKPDQAPSATPTPPKSNLSFSEPSDHAVINSANIKISGQALPDSLVAVTSETDDALVATDESGNFSVDFKLAGGENYITATALFPNQNTETKTVSVIYTTAKLVSETQTDLTATPIASDSQTLVTQTTEEIIKNAKERSKQTEAILDNKADRERLVGYSGAISDIKQGVFSLGIRGETIQISHNDETAIIKDGSPTKPEFLALTDQAIVIGNLSGPDIISAKRIVVFKTVAPKYTKKIAFSSIVKIDTKKETLSLIIDGKTQEVSLGKLVKLDLAELTSTQKIFGIVMTNTTTNTVSLIQAKVI